MTVFISHKRIQKALQGVFLTDLYVKVVKVCTACARIYCRETCTRLVKLSVQRRKLNGVYTLRKGVSPYTLGL